MKIIANPLHHQVTLIRPSPQTFHISSPLAESSFPRIQFKDEELRFGEYLHFTNINFPENKILADHCFSRTEHRFSVYTSLIRLENESFIASFFVNCLFPLKSKQSSREEKQFLALSI